ncbi:hypothetical protein [Catellatospora sp. TT07R-123]|uniref:hypothetical protein n=1 Tax=Catellatospora sp. TT07R-123 TaxID=2733863 RepID=UPI001BB414D1|nr:hypothetical protein [Catellatospora sp. TT07R-123]
MQPVSATMGARVDRSCLSVWTRGWTAAVGCDPHAVVRRLRVEDTSSPARTRTPLTSGCPAP